MVRALRRVRVIKDAVNEMLEKSNLRRLMGESVPQNAVSSGIGHGEGNVGLSGLARCSVCFASYFRFSHADALIRV